MGKLYKKVVRTYKTGDVIFEQGADCDGIYSLKSGRVSVYKTKLTPSGPVDMELVKLGPGSMFGEMGMLDQTKRDASVKALEYSEVLVITPDMFEDQMKNLPPWVVNFIKILISRLRITNEKLVAAQQRLEAGGLLVHGESTPALESVTAASHSNDPEAVRSPGTADAAGTAAA